MAAPQAEPIAAQQGEIANNDHEFGEFLEDGVKLEGEELRSALLKQLTYYFSRENLATDSYLVSQMNADLYVPISIIANFKMVKQLTEDVTLITELLQTCEEVIVDTTNSMVKPNINVPRTTIILRNISAETPKAEVEAIFDHESCSKPKSVRSDIENTWFVTFTDENSTVDTLFALKSLKFQDRPIQAGVKSENIFKQICSFPPPVAEVSSMRGGYQVYNNVNLAMIPPWSQTYYDPNLDPNWSGQQRRRPGGRGWQDGDQQQRRMNNNNNNNKNNTRRKDNRNDRNDRPDRAPNSNGNPRPGPPRDSNFRYQKQKVTLGLDQFPPLPNSNNGPPPKSEGSSNPPQKKYSAVAVESGSFEPKKRRPSGRKQNQSAEKSTEIVEVIEKTDEVESAKTEETKEEPSVEDDKTDTTQSNEKAEDRPKSEAQRGSQKKQHKDSEKRPAKDERKQGNNKEKRPEKKNAVAPSKQVEKDTKEKDDQINDTPATTSYAQILKQKGTAPKRDYKKKAAKTEKNSEEQNKTEDSDKPSDTDAKADNKAESAKSETAKPEPAATTS